MPQYRSGKFEFMSSQYGLNTRSPAFALISGEAAELLNFKVKRGGVKETRTSIKRYTASAVNTVKNFAEINLSGTDYELLTDSLYKLYYLNGSKVPVELGTLEGDVEFIAFAGYALLLDGSYLKYIDGAVAPKIAYDNGTGSSGYQVNNLAADSDTFLALGNGTNIGVAQKFTSQAWDSGYTIPPTTVSVNLSANNSPNASAVTAVLRLVADCSVLATKTLVADASTLTTEDTYSVTFTDSDITTEMSPSTEMYMSIEHSGGDASNYVKVHCNDIGSGGLAFTCVTDCGTPGNWSADTAKNCIIGLRPGRPPKGLFGVVHNNRVFMKDPDNPGWVRFSNGDTFFDWSTASYAGYVGTVDSSSTSFPVGAMSVLYENLYVFGMESQPYVCALSGDTPSNYALNKTGQEAWSTHRTITVPGNDIWFSGEFGTSAFTGVQEFGDLRVFPYSEAIENKYSNWDTDTAIGGYYPKDGQYWLYMPTYNRVLVCNIKAPTRDPSGYGIRYPWCEYEFVRDVLTSDSYKWTANGDEYFLEAAAGGDPSIDEPDFVTIDGKNATNGTAGLLNDHEWDYALDPTTTYYTVYIKDASGDPDDTGIIVKSIIAPQRFSTVGNNIYFGSTDGYVYVTDSTLYKDRDSHHPTYDWRSPYKAASGNYVTVTKQQIIIAGSEGARLNFSIYRNDEQLTATKTTQLELSIDDRLTIGELSGQVEDAYYLVDQEGNKNWKATRCTGYSFQARVHELLPGGKPVTSMGCFFEYVEAR